MYTSQRFQHHLQYVGTLPCESRKSKNVTDFDSKANTGRDRVQQLTSPRFRAIVLDRTAVGHAPTKGPGHFSWIIFQC